MMGSFVLEKAKISILVIPPKKYNLEKKIILNTFQDNT